MRICLITHEYPPFYGGGIGTYARNIVRYFLELGHTVHVITNQFDYGSTDARHKLPFWNEGLLYVHRLPALDDDWELPPARRTVGSLNWDLYHGCSPYLYYSVCVAEKLREIITEYEIDVVEAAECAAEAFHALRLRRHGLAFEALPFVIMLHSPINDIYFYNEYSRYDVGFQRRNYMEEYSILHADAVCSPSRLLGEIVWRRLGLDPSQRPCATIPLPIDFEPVSAAAVPNTDAPYVLFTGRLEMRKGVQHIVRAALEVLPRHPHYKFRFIGSDCHAGRHGPSMVAYLKSLIPPRWQSSFEFLGRLPREELQAHYAGAAFCCFAPPWDNFPTTCAEAMASQKAVIGSHYSGIAEMVEDGVSGLIFESGNVADLAAKLDCLMGNPALAREMGLAAERRIRAYCDPREVVARKIEHYQQSIDRAAAKTRPFISAPAGTGSRIEAFIPNHTSAEAIENTIASLQAVSSCAEIAIHVVGTRHWVNLDRDVPGVIRGNSERAEDSSALAVFLEQATAEYLLMLEPGDRVAPDFIVRAIACFQRFPRAAWVGAWLDPASAGAGRFLGFDFSLPLQAVAYQPPPFVLLRRGALEDAGGLDLELPPGCREWELYCRLAARGYEGYIIPLFLGSYVGTTSRDGSQLRQPPPGAAQAWALERISQTCPEVFRNYGALLYGFAHVRPRAQSQREDGGHIPPTAEEVRLTTYLYLSGKLKRRFPRLAYRLAKLRNQLLWRR